MSDEMDACEYMWTHELAMRRLLSILRHGQSYCSDTECTDLPLTMPTPSSGLGDDSNNFLMITIFMIMAFALYIFRPNNLRAITGNNGRNNNNNNEKPPPSSSNGRGQSPPPPPPAVD